MRDSAGRFPFASPDGRAQPGDDGPGTLLDQLPEDSRRALRRLAVSVPLVAGDWLFRQGEPGDAMYLLVSGALEVVLERPAPATVIRTLRRGATLGEISMLTASPRSASVRARRDSELLRVTHSDMGTLITDYPPFALALSRVLALQLEQGTSRPKVSSRIPDEVIAVVPAHPGVAVEPLRAALIAGLRQSRSVCSIDVGNAGEQHGGGVESVARYATLLDNMEKENDHVVLMAASLDGSSAWDRFCLRQADRVVVVAHSGSAPPRGEARGMLLGCDLVFTDDAPQAAAMSEWAQRIEPRTVYLAGTGPNLARTVRRLTGRSVGVVLSGGGARGLAHIGALDMLAESGVEIDRVGGASMGAFVGALHTLGCTGAEATLLCRRELVDHRPFNDYTVPRVSLIKARKAEAMMRRVFASTAIEELSRPFFCVSADLLGGQVVRHDAGLLWEAVGTSMSLPGLCPPVRRDGRVLVDGGVLNNLPVDLMSAAEGPIIAVDVMVRELPGAGRGRAGRGVRAAFRPWQRAATAEPPPGIVDTLSRSTVLGSWRLAEENRAIADMVISPDVGGIAMFGFDQLDAAVAAGREAARTALEEQTDPL